MRLWGRTADAVLSEACELMGGPVDTLWSWQDVAEWQGPPAIWAAWR